MNIMQVQAALKSLDDNALKQEMLSPGMAPQFLVLSEMQRRQEIRNGGRPSQVPQSNMKDEALQGLGALPEAPQGPPQGMPQGAPQGFAGGGPVGYAGGGQVVINGRVYNADDLDPEELAYLQRGSAVGRYLGAGPQALKGLYGAAVAGVPAQLAPAPPVAPPRSGPAPGDPLRQRELELATQRGQAVPAGAYDSPASLGFGAMPASPVLAGASDSPEALGYGGGSGAAPTAGLPGLRSSSGLGPSSLPMYPATRTASLIESGLGANTNHGGSFKGVLGLGDGMWKDYRDRLGLKESDRENPEAQRRIYETFSDDQRKLNPKATDSDVYTAWAAGPGAASAFRRNPQGDAFSTYSGVTNPKLAEKAFSTNTGLLERGMTNAQVLAAYKGRWDRAAGPGGQPGSAFPGEGDTPAGTDIRVAAPGSGAAAVTGDSGLPAAVVDRGGDGHDFESYRARTRGVDRFAGFEDEAKALYGDKAERTKQAGAFALLETGLGIMGSNSPRLAGAVSEGGLAGLKSYRVGLEEARRGEREGFSARLGIAGARAGQDQSNDRLAATVYGTDTQANSALRVAQLGSDTQKGIATLQAGTQDAVSRRQAQTQLDVAGIQAEAQRIAYGRNPQQDLAKWILEAPDGPERQARMDAAGRFDPSGYRDQAGMTALNNSYNVEANRLRDDIIGNQQAQLLLSPTEKAEKKREYAAAIRELQSRPHYQRLFQGGAAPAAAPGALPDPLGLR